MSHTRTSDVLVIGGGLAGGYTAYALARRGLRVRILEAANSLAQKASGNRFGLITPYLTTRPSPLETLYSTGFEFSQHVLTNELRHPNHFRQCGAIQFPATSRLQQTLSATNPLLGRTTVKRVTKDEATAIAGVASELPAFYIPEAGYVSPAEFLKDLLTQYQYKITVQCDARAAHVDRSDNRWEVKLSDGSSFVAAHVVICGAYESSGLYLTSWLPLEPVRGQTIFVSSTPTSNNLRTLLCFGGYVVPETDNTHFVGAHYRHHDLEEAIAQSDTAEIIKTCNKWLPSLKLHESDVRSARVCFRTSTIDRLPYIGRLPDFYSMKREAGRYRSGTDLTAKVPLQTLHGLHINVGHGSRGLLSCPLGGEIIARLINEEPLAELENSAKVCCPSRLPHRLLTSSTR